MFTQGCSWGVLRFVVIENAVGLGGNTLDLHRWGPRVRGKGKWWSLDEDAVEWEWMWMWEVSDVGSKMNKDDVAVAWYWIASLGWGAREIAKFEKWGRDQSARSYGAWWAACVDRCRYHIWLPSSMRCYSVYGISLVSMSIYGKNRVLLMFVFLLSLTS